MEKTTNWKKSSTSELIDHIEQTHHRYLKSELPLLQTMMDNLTQSTTYRDSEDCEAFLLPLREIFVSFREELEEHMFKEEQILFPFIQQLEDCREGEVARPAIGCGTVAGPIRQMKLEHENALCALMKMRQLTNNFSIPDPGNDFLATLYGRLKALESDLLVHMALENDVLFPRIASMEKEKSVGRHLDS